jgi:protein-disulfide isomerase
MKPVVFSLCLVLLLLGVIVPFGVRGQVNPNKPEKCLGGSYDAPIRIDVFSDFQCAHCRDFFLNTIPSVLEDYCSLNKVCVVYHEFPLRNNIYSRKAAQYSLAAQKLGRDQWRSVMTALYQHQETWAPTGNIEDVVAKVLTADDFSRLKKLLLDPSLDKEIDGDIALGEKNEVSATPTILVNALGREQKVVGSISFPILKDFFDSIVK